MNKSTIIAIGCLVGLLIYGLVSTFIFQEDGRIGYSYSTISIADKGLRPLTSSEFTGKYHVLGTDRLGRDTLACIGNGIKVALSFSVLASFLAVLIGGIIAYFSTLQYLKSIQVRKWKLLGIALGIWYICYLIGLWIKGSNLEFTFFSISYISFVFLIFRETILRGTLSADDATIKVMEVWKSLPVLLILIIIASMVENISYIALAMIIALLLWPGYVRLMRAEFIRLSKQDYIKSALASGASTLHIYIYHLLPNTITPLVAKFCFGLINIILLEATLSFLGIGIPVEEVSLGSMIKASTDRISYWWLSVFPGLTLMILLLSLNTLGTWFISKER